VYLASHWVRVDLAHVGTAIVHLDIGDVQFPSVMTIMSHREPWVVSHHMRMDGEDGLRVGLDPRHLHERTLVYFHEKNKTSDKTCQF
jgi:hypothetical protein